MSVRVERAGEARWRAWERWACTIVPALVATALGMPFLFGERWMADTPYYQAIAMQSARGTLADWWTLHEGSVQYFNKPPLAFWMHALSVRIFGEVDYAYRLPELLWFVLTCVLTARLARRVYGGAVGARIGVFAGAVMALTDDWVWRVSNFRLEFLVTVSLIGALVCWVEAFGIGREQEPGDRAADSSWNRAWWAIGAGVCLGLALLTKPLIALGMLPLGAVWLALIGRLDQRNLLMLGVSAGAAVCVALPWHLSMVIMHGRAFTDAYFVNQSYKRATGQMFNPEPWYWYFQHMADGARDVKPYRMLAIYGAALAGVALIAVRGLPREKRAGDVLALLYTFGWLIALCVFKDKRNYYLLVIHPGTALLAGRLLGSVIPGGIVRWMSVAGAMTGMVLLGRAMVTAPKYRERIPLPPERQALVDFIKAHAGEKIYNGGLTYQEPAIVYIHTGVWPIYFLEKEIVQPEQVPPGGLIVYREDQLGRADRPARIDPNDEEVFRVRGAGKPAPNIETRTYIVVRRRGETK